MNKTSKIGKARKKTMAIGVHSKYNEAKALLI
jgi:hypothetical protein